VRDITAKQIKESRRAAQEVGVSSFDKATPIETKEKGKGDSGRHERSDYNMEDEKGHA